MTRENLTTNLDLRYDYIMHELRIGDISRLTGRTTEHIRRMERAGRIPAARRDKCFRHWPESDLPAIYEGLGVEPPPTPAERVLQEALALLGIEPSASLEETIERIEGELTPAVKSMLDTGELARVLETAGVKDAWRALIPSTT